METADCIANMKEIAALPGIDILFLGQNDLCMSMGLFAREYVFPAMYFSKELNEATDTLVRRSSSLWQQCTAHTHFFLPTTHFYHLCRLHTASGPVSRLVPFPSRAADHECEEERHHPRPVFVRN